MDDEELSRRIELLEAQLEKLAEAVITLARIEERQLQHNKEIEQIHANQKEISNEAFERLRSIEAKLTINTTKMSISDKVWWMIVTVIISTTLALIIKHILLSGVATGL